MIRPSYCLKLARTKLSSKRGVLVTSVIVASLLFAALIVTVIVFTGAQKSAVEFIKQSGNDRYLVKVSPYIPYEQINFSLHPSLKEVRKIKAFEKRYYQQLKDKYKSLGLKYSQESEIPALQPWANAPDTLPEEQRVTVNFSSPIIQAMNARKFREYAKSATNKLSDLRQIGNKYGATGYYFVDKPSGLPVIPGTRFIQDGKEDFSVSELKSANPTNYGYYTKAIYNSNYTFTDQRLLERYLLTTDTSDLKGIPVVVSAQEAVALFGKKLGVVDEPKSAGQKKAWLKDLQAKLNGQTYQACYRNSAELSLLDKIQRDYADIKNNENNKNYVKPKLIYDYPAKACGDIVIKQDARTATDKQADAELEANQRKLGSYVAPMHRLLTFQIVGVKYAQPQTDHIKTADQYVKNLLVSSDDSWSLNIPIQMYQTL
ncbi:hypothetical protein CR956_00870, partial [Candidatus Saccharibacteria bacterium]